MTRQSKQRLSNRTNTHNPVQNDPLFNAYERGRRYLDLRRAGQDKVNHGKDFQSLTRFSKDRAGREIIAELAVAMGTSDAALKDDAKFAAAVETLVANCGESALAVLFDVDRPQSIKDIFKISRKSRERQRYRIELVVSGQAMSVGPQNTDRVPDTMNFAKALNRLARALGSLSACLRLLKRHKAALPGEARNDLLKTARACAKEVRQFYLLLSTIPVNDASSESAKPSRQSAAPKLKFPRIRGQSKSALALIAKNVRDLPVSSYDLRPSPAELHVGREECAKLRRACSEIAAELNRLSA